MNDRLTLTIEETARLLNIGRTLAYELARRDVLPVVHYGRRVLVVRAELEAQLSDPEWRRQLRGDRG